MLLGIEHSRIHQHNYIHGKMDRLKNVGVHPNAVLRRIFFYCRGRGEVLSYVFLPEYSFSVLDPFHFLGEISKPRGMGDRKKEKRFSPRL